MRPTIYVLTLCFFTLLLFSCTGNSPGVMNSNSQTNPQDQTAIQTTDQLEARYLSSPQDMDWRFPFRHWYGPFFKAFLNGAADSTDSQGIGVAMFRFSADSTLLYFKLIVANINDVTMAHIHLMADSSNTGPIVLWLYPSTPPAQLIPGTFNGILAADTVSAANLVGPLAGMTLNDLRADMLNGLTYVNVHTSLYPAGEIRGDIRPLGRWGFWVNRHEYMKKKDHGHHGNHGRR
jgi:hypothetical protein